MPSAHREAVRDFATTDHDIRMDIAGQVVERRKALGYTPLQLAEASKVTEMNLLLVEQGVAFEGSHEIACAALESLARIENWKEGLTPLRLVV